MSSTPGLGVAGHPRGIGPTWGHQPGATVGRAATGCFRSGRGPPACSAVPGVRRWGGWRRHEPTPSASVRCNHWASGRHRPWTLECLPSGHERRKPDKFGNASAWYTHHRNADELAVQLAEERLAAADAETDAIVSRAVRWERRLEQLRAFKAENGHLTIPHSGAWISLNSWVYRQRQRQNTLSPERHAALEELGVCWEPAKRPPRHLITQDVDKWGERLEELRAFKAGTYTRSLFSST